MPIQIVVHDTFENTQKTVRAALTDCGYSVSDAPMTPGTVLQAKMSIWMGTKGNETLAMFLGFIFKVESVSALITAYEDGTTAIAIREAGALGGHTMSAVGRGVGRAVGGLAGTVIGELGSAAGSVDDASTKNAAMAKSMQELETKLRQRIGSRVAYEGPARLGALPLPG